MYRKFRLSDHRKNEFRRRSVETTGLVVTSDTVALQPGLSRLHEAPDSDSELLVSIPMRLLQAAQVSSTEQLRSRISSQYTLPSGWIDVTVPISSGDDGFTLAKMHTNGLPPAASIKFTLSVHNDSSWTVYCNGKQFPASSSLLSSMPQSISSIQDVVVVINFLDSLSPCCGNSERKFLPLIEMRKGSFVDASGSEIARYEDDVKTIRHTNCQLYVSSSDNLRCDSCRKYRKTLYTLVARLDKSQTDDIDRTNPASHANYRYLSCSEKDRRLKRFHQLHRADKQKIARLQSALDAAIQQRGVNIDEELHQDLRQTMDEMNERVCEQYQPGLIC